MHYFRSPLERVEGIAPFRYLDSDPFAVAADGRIVWLVNGLGEDHRRRLHPARRPLSDRGRADRPHVGGDLSGPLRARRVDAGEDYGRLSILQVPKGLFFPGPEQADSSIDQDPFISQQISLWNRLGLDVIRGHTTPLVVEGEVFYVEPLFIKSAQNAVPQLKRVIVVFRGEASMGVTLEEALRIAVEGEEQEAQELTSP